MSRFTPPYLGAAYYPEAWPLDQVDEDIRLMLDAGLNVMRVAEFAWSSMEPEEGHIDLAWLHRVVDKLAAAGIATIMCTPTCTPPAWLTENYPEVLVVDHNGERAQHGSRRHVCPNSPVYRDHCERITRELGEAFGRDDRVIGWQIDNEVYLWREWGCYCDLCTRKFQERLQAQFGAIEALNEAWGTKIWSQTYQSFWQIPAPRPRFCHHPTLLAAWTLFQNDSLVDYIAHQAAILHEYVFQPVGTDMMPFMGLSYEQTHRHLDIVQYNHYDTMDNLWRQVFWMDYVRTFKDVPFWNTETATCWNGGTTSNGFKDPGFCRANSWLPIALGGEANLYWLWRTHWSGQELMHGSLVTTSGRPQYMIEEVRETARGFNDAAEFLNSTRPSPPGFAVHFSTLAWAQLRFQPLVEGFDYIDAMLSRVYRPLMDVHLRADIIDPAASLHDYRLVFSPFVPSLDESGLRERLYNWIHAGGTWVVGPFTDIRDEHGAKPTHAPFACLEEWAGVFCRYEVPGDPRGLALRYIDDTESHGSLWHSGFECQQAKSLAVYTEGPLEGLSALTEVRVGEGRIILLGTLPPGEDLKRLMLQAASQCGIHPAAEATPNVLVVPREGEAGEGIIAVELENKPGTLALPTPARDLLSEKVYARTVEISPYQVLVLSTAAETGGGLTSESRKQTAGGEIPQTVRR